MKRRMFLAAALGAVCASPLAADQDLGGLNATYKRQLEDDISYQEMLSYVNSVDALMVSGKGYTARQLVQAYRNLGAIKKYAEGRKGAKWELLAQRANDVQIKVAKAYSKLTGGGDITKAAKELAKKLEEALYPPIIRQPQKDDP